VTELILTSHLNDSAVKIFYMGLARDTDSVWLCLSVTGKSQVESWSHL